MHDRGFATIEKSRRPSPCVVDDLVRHDQRTRPEIGANPAHRGHRDNPLRAGPFHQRPDVRAVIDAVRRNRMPVTMAGQKNHLLPADATMRQRT